MRILLAEDNPTSRLILEAMLQKWGWEAISTENGRQALEVLTRKDAPKLAILDILMPEMDGLAVIRHVREIPSNNPPYMILLTSLGDRENIVDGLKAGANDYIVKPFENSELQARIEVGRKVVELQGLLARRVEELETALSQVRVLKGLLPICSYCKKIRDDQGYWNQIEGYIREHSEAEFSHSLCPGCIKKYHPDLDLD